MVSIEFDANWSTEDDAAPSTAVFLFPESGTMEYQYNQTSNDMACKVDAKQIISAVILEILMESRQFLSPR